MRKIIVLEYMPDREMIVERAMDDMAMAGVQIITGQPSGSMDAHLVPHFHYICPKCGWVLVTAISDVSACPKCGNKKLDVSPDGVIVVNTYVPSFVVGGLTT